MQDGEGRGTSDQVTSHSARVALDRVADRLLEARRTAHEAGLPDIVSALDIALHLLARRFADRLSMIEASALER